MAGLSSVDEILDFAIKNEEEAHRFYADLARRVEKQYLRPMLEEFAREELGHKAKLAAIKRDKVLAPQSERITELDLADYLVDVEPGPDLDYQEVLIVAMKKEKAAFKLYSDLAARAPDEGLRATFLMLAQEEAKHKLRFEVEYDEAIMKEN